MWSSADKRRRSAGPIGEQGATAAAATAQAVAEDAFFEVRVLALNTYFLGHHGPQGLMLTPMLDDAALGLVAGQSRPATEIFALLQPHAFQHNGQST